MNDSDVSGSIDAAASYVEHEDLSFDGPGFLFGPPTSVSDDILRAQDGERLRLGRELHDSTGQLLVALSLNVAQLRHAPHPGIADELLGEIDDTIHQIDQEIRTFSFINYPAELGTNDLVAALEIFARSFGKRTGQQVKFHSCCKHAQAHPAVAIALLRIAQEAMANVHRHAHASSVHLSLVQRRGLIELIVKDDGCGLPPADRAAILEGVGLKGMRHRIERLGGSFRIRRMKQGTKVTASLCASRFYTRGQLIERAA